MCVLRPRYSYADSPGCSSQKKSGKPMKSPCLWLIKKWKHPQMPALWHWFYHINCISYPIFHRVVYI